MSMYRCQLVCSRGFVKERFLREGTLEDMKDYVKFWQWPNKRKGDVWEFDKWDIDEDKIEEEVWDH